MFQNVPKDYQLMIRQGPGEQHELAVKAGTPAKQIEGSGVTSKAITDNLVALNWKVSATRQVVQVGDLLVYILDRNSAYNLWVPDFARTDEWGTL